MNPQNPHASARSGFTLIELLVVIVILAILASISVPIFNGVKRKANSTKSAANLRTIGAALAAYESDNDGRMPALEGAPQIPQLTNWVSELIIALNDDATAAELAQAPPLESFISPGITWGDESGNGIIANDDLLYTYSATDSLVGFNYDDQPDPKQGRRTSSIEKRVESLLLVEGAQQGTSPHSHPSISWSEASTDLSTAGGSFVEFRYRNRLNALMGDYSIRSFGKNDAAEIEMWHWSGFNYPDNY